MIAYEVIKEAYYGEKFKQFIQEKLIPFFLNHRDSILIMYNCRFHQRVDVLRLLNQNLIEYKFLPAYSAQLYPIEEFFATIKDAYKAFRPRPQTSDEIHTIICEIMENSNLSLTIFMKE